MRFEWDLKQIMDSLDEDDIKAGDDELYMKLVQRLPVSTFNDYDPNIPPENGADYLRRVQLEAQKEPKIKVASKISPLFKNFYDQTESIRENEFIKSKPQFLVPEESVVPGLIESFDKLRKHLEQLRSNNNDNLEKPIKRTRKWWYEYSFGKNTGQPKFMDYELQNDYQTNLPRLLFLSRISQQEIRRLLNYHYEWMKESHLEVFRIESCLWIYSLMAALDLIQTNETYCLLRQISRLCSQQRNQLEKTCLEDDLTLAEAKLIDQLASLNLIILLIGHYFKQKDLLDTHSE